MKHKLDYAPEVVGTEEDWYLKDENGIVISRDAYGNPAPHDPLWVAARKNANGHQFDVRDDGELIGACIGGSSASICAGVFPGHEDGCRENTFNSKLHLYYELRNEEALYSEIDDSKQIIFKIGHDYEDGIARTGLPEINKTYLAPRGLTGWLVNDTRMFRCAVTDENGNLKYPHAIADMDRLIYCYPTGVAPLLDDPEWVRNNPPVEIYGDEIKSTRKVDAHKWGISDYNPVGVPENYLTQVHHYMAVCNIDGFFVTCQGYSMHPDDLLIRFVPRDIDLEERILENEERFIKNALLGIKPDVKDDVAEKRLKTEGEHTAEYAETTKAEAFAIDSELADSVYYIAAIDKQLADLDAAYKANQSQLLEARKTAELTLKDSFADENKSFGCIKGTVDGKTGMFFIHQNHKKGRAVTDCEKLETEQPTLASVCVKKTAVATGLTKAQKELLAQYQTIPVKPELETTVTFSADEDFDAKKKSKKKKN